MSDLVADDAVGKRQRLGAAYLDDLAVIHGDRETAGIGTIERTDARTFCSHHLQAPWLCGIDVMIERAARQGTIHVRTVTILFARNRVDVRVRRRRVMP